MRTVVASVWVSLEITGGFDKLLIAKKVAPKLKNKKSKMIIEIKIDFFMNKNVLPHQEKVYYK